MFFFFFGGGHTLVTVPLYIMAFTTVDFSFHLLVFFFSLLLNIGCTIVITRGVAIFFLLVSRLLLQGRLLVNHLLFNKHENQIVFHTVKQGILTYRCIVDSDWLNDEIL